MQYCQVPIFIRKLLHNKKPKIDKIKNKLFCQFNMIDKYFEISV